MDTYKVVIKVIYDKGEVHKFLSPIDGTFFYIKILPREGDILRIGKFYHRTILVEYVMHEKKKHVNRFELDATLVVEYLGTFRAYKSYIKNTLS